MKKPEMSIIVTAFNAEAYLRSCFECLHGQTFQDWELLMIDDGSTDETARLCDEFAQQDTRIRVFHEQHLGVAHARQVGIDNVRGEYTIHIDADDTISPTMLEEMCQTAIDTNADMLICDYKELNSNGCVYHVQKPTSLTKEAVVNDLMEGKLYGALWNKLIRSSAFRDNRVNFRQELRMREDMFFVFDVIPYVKHIAYLPKAFYIYDRTNNSGSLTNTYLCEDRNYYDQEVCWHETALKNSLVCDVQKSRLRNSLLNYAYITLNGKIYTKAEWYEMFVPFIQTFRQTDKSYKKLLVKWAINGHYRSASFLRRILALIGKKI